MPNACKWVEEEAGELYQTECGNCFQTGHGTATENEFRYCCFCGGPLIEVPYTDLEEEDEDADE